MTDKLKRLIHGIASVIVVYFSALPSVWVTLNPLLYIMFLPLGVHYAMTLPWPFLKDIPDPFGRGTSLYFLSYVYTALWRSPFWEAVESFLMLFGACLFSWSFLLWLRSRGKLMTNGPYKVVRHPQYLGAIIAVLGLSLRSARPAALVSWGTMTYAYFLMAYFEELSLTKKSGEEYASYKAKTWFMLPVPRVLTKRHISAETVVAAVASTSTLVLYILAVIYLSPNHVVSLRGVTYYPAQIPGHGTSIGLK